VRLATYTTAALKNVCVQRLYEAGQPAGDELPSRSEFVDRTLELLELRVYLAHLYGLELGSS